MNNTETLRGEPQPAIDGVYYALQGSRPFEIADGLGDTYLEIWQLATMPEKRIPFSQSEQEEISRAHMTPDTLRRDKIIRRMAILEFMDAAITPCLSAASDPAEHTLLDAYRETLTDIKNAYAISEQAIALRVASLQESPTLLPWFLRD